MLGCSLTWWSSQQWMKACLNNLEMFCLREKLIGSVFMTFICLGIHPRSVFHHKKIGVPDSKDHQVTFGQQRPVIANLGVPNHCTSVTVLWHPWVGQKKEPVWVSVLSVYWMTPSEVRWTWFSVSWWLEYSTELLPWVAARKTSSGNITFSLRRQHLQFGRISLPVAHRQAWPDVEHRG